MLCWFSHLEVMFGIYLSPSMYIYQLSPCYARMYGCSFFPPFLVINNYYSPGFCHYAQVFTDELCEKTFLRI